MKPTTKPMHIRKEGKVYVFDLLRKKYVLATPEEEVRQQLLQYLVTQLSYPKGLISVEAGLVYNRQQKRTDIVVYNNLGLPHILIECKRPEIKLGKEVIYQMATYNREINASLLVIANGKEMICLQVDAAQNKLVPLTEIPPYKELII